MGGMNHNQQMPQGQPLLPMTSGFPGQSPALPRLLPSLLASSFSFEVSLSSPRAGVLQGMGPMPGNPGMPGRPSLVQGGGRWSRGTERRVGRDVSGDAWRAGLYADGANERAARRWNAWGE